MWFWIQGQIQFGLTVFFVLCGWMVVLMGCVFVLPVVLSERRDPRGSAKLGSTISQFSRIVHEQRGSSPYRGHIELSLMSLECGALHRNIVVHCSTYDSNDPQKTQRLVTWQRLQYLFCVTERYLQKERRVAIFSIWRCIGSPL
jgi:hypothetical protein